jgi:hypothetical protein
MLPKRTKVFWFFFSKKNCFLPVLRKRRNHTKCMQHNGQGAGEKYGAKPKQQALFLRRA